MYRNFAISYMLIFLVAYNKMAVSILYHVSKCDFVELDCLYYNGISNKLEDILKLKRCSYSTYFANSIFYSKYLILNIDMIYSNGKLNIALDHDNDFSLMETDINAAIQIYNLVPISIYVKNSKENKLDSFYKITPNENYDHKIESTGFHHNVPRFNGVLKGYIFYARQKVSKYMINKKDLINNIHYILDSVKSTDVDINKVIKTMEAIFSVKYKQSTDTCTIL